MALLAALFLAAALLVLVLVAAPARAGEGRSHLHSITARDMGGPVAVGGMFFDRERGRLYVTDVVDRRILAFDASFAFVSEFTAGGALQCPGALVRDTQGRFMVAEPCRSRVAVIDMAARTVRDLPLPTPDGGNPSDPRSLAMSPDGRLLVADRANGRIMTFGPDLSSRGEYALDGCRALAAVGVDGAGRIYALDSLDGVVRVLGPDGRERLRFGRRGEGRDDFLFPSGLAVDPKGLVHVLDRHRDTVRVFDGQGRPVSSYGRHGWREGRLHSPAAIYADGLGRMYIVDTQNARISIFQ